MLGGVRYCVSSRTAIGWCLVRYRLASYDTTGLASLQADSFDRWRVPASPSAPAVRFLRSGPERRGDGPKFVYAPAAGVLI
jgi:hypothetical protein